MPVITASEWGVDGGAKVRLEDDTIVVTWTCGDTRTFTREDLEHTIEMLQYAIRHDSWFTHEDSDLESFSCLVRDGRFYAAAGPGQDGAQSIDWQDFSAALEAALGREKPPVDDIVEEAFTAPAPAPVTAAPRWARRILPASWFGGA